MFSAAIIDLLSLAIRWIPIRVDIIPSTMNGVRWWLGKDTALLLPGWHVYIPWAGDITGNSILPQVVETEAQVVETDDGKAWSMTVAIHYRIKDVRKHVTSVEDFDDSLPNMVQLRLQQNVRGLTDKEFRELDVCSTLLEEAQVQAEKWGVEIIELDFVTCCRVRVYHLTSGTLSGV